MFDHITGKIDSVGDNRIVVDCGGVGFLLTCSSWACADYSRMQAAKIPVYLSVREDALELYGFRDEQERRLFVLLIGVTGVGAKLAITVLSGLPVAKLLSAIAAGDAATVSTVKGVGKKIAERIVLELKSKAAEFGVMPSGDEVGSALVDEKAVLALVGLGYDKKEAEAAVKKVAKPDMTTEDILRAVLQG